MQSLPPLVQCRCLGHLVCVAANARGASAKGHAVCSRHQNFRHRPTQLFVAGYMPAAACGAAAAAVAAAALVNGAKLVGLLDRLPGGGRLWGLWAEVLGLVGLVILPQVRMTIPSLPAGASSVWRALGCRVMR